MSTTYEKAKAGLKPVFDSIPKGKFRLVFQEASDIENGLNQLAGLLTGIRQYFLDTTGEESPFVKQIDKLIPRV